MAVTRGGDCAKLGLALMGLLRVRVRVRRILIGSIKPLCSIKSLTPWESQRLRIYKTSRNPHYFSIPTHSYRLPSLVSHSQWYCTFHVLCMVIGVLIVLDVISNLPPSSSTTMMAAATTSAPVELGTLHDVMQGIILTLFNSCSCAAGSCNCGS